MFEIDDVVEVIFREGLGKVVGISDCDCPDNKGEWYLVQIAFGKELAVYHSFSVTKLPKHEHTSY